MPEAKDVHLISNSPYTAPSFRDVRLDFLFRVFFLTDSLTLAEAWSGLEAEVPLEDALTLTDSTVRLTRIGSYFEDYLEDGLEVADALALGATMEFTDRLRFGDGLHLWTLHPCEDTLTVSDELTVYLGEYGRKWGMLYGRVQPYQERT